MYTLYILLDKYHIFKLYKMIAILSIVTLYVTRYFSGKLTDTPHQQFYFIFLKRP